MKILILLVILNFINITNAFSGTDIINEINYSSNVDKETIIDRIKNKLSLNYFINISGPTLANPTQGHTYSRFQSGKTWDERYDLDPKTNQNYFNSFSLNYKYSSDITIGYSYAFDNVITKNVNFRSKISRCKFDSKLNQCQKDSKGFYILDNGYFEVSNKRNESQNFYNQRINAYFSNIFENNFLGISSGSSIELPTTDYAKNDGLNYALILTPTLYFKTNNLLHSTGLSFELIKNNYQKNILLGQDGANARKMRTFQVTVSPYYNYQLTDSLTLKTSLTFDWDQTGDQSGFDFNENMDDVWRIGLGKNLTKQISSTVYIEGAIKDMSTNRSFIGANLGIQI